MSANETPEAEGVALLDLLHDALIERTTDYRWVDEVAAALDAALAPFIAARVATAKSEVIDLLGARLELMRGVRDHPNTDWAAGFDDGWESAALQVNESILNPRVEAYVRRESPRFRPASEREGDE